MRIDWATLALQAVNLAILIWILRRFLFRPIADIVQRRRAEAAALTADAAAEKAKAEKLRAEAEAETLALAAKRAEALAAVAEEAEGQRRTLIDAAHAEAAALVAKGRDDARRARDEEQAEIAREAGALALGIADKLLARLPDEARVRGFVDGLAAAAAALPTSARAEIGDGERLILKSARALDDAEKGACRAALEKPLGRAVDIDFVVEPALIAGLELEAPHAVVANSWRADLDAIAKELARHA